MAEADALRQINLQQLATATDRVLSLGHRQRRTNPGFARGSYAQFSGVDYEEFEKTVRDPRVPEHTELVRAQSPRTWGIQQPLLVAVLILAIVLVLLAASTIVGNAAAGAVGLSGAIGGTIGGILAFREARRG